jgi:predicted metalloenzyme YecM
LSATRQLQALLGNYKAFFADLKKRIVGAGIDIHGCPVSHIAFRTASFAEYSGVRDALRQFCSREVENKWNGRLINKLLLDQPLVLDADFHVFLIELIPPRHQREYPMGLEHVGIVIGESFDAFTESHNEVLTGRQDQGPYCQPAFITFDNNRTVKFYRYGLKDVVEMEGRTFAVPVRKSGIRKTGRLARTPDAR